MSVSAAPQPVTPAVGISNSRIEDLKKRSFEILEKNRRVTNGNQYTLPSPTSYPYQWLWDSCFHAIVLSHLSPDDAKKEIKSLFVKQFENGMIPHMIYWEKGELHDIDWGREGTSSITQPPMIAYAAWSIFQRDGDKKFLEEIFPGLFHFYQYLLHERDPHERHLIGIINPDESGEDNSPRFDSMLDLPPKHDVLENFRRRLGLVAENRTCDFDAPFCMKNFFWVKDVPFNAILVENLHAMARIAQKLDRAYDAEYFAKEAERVSASMRELMFEDGRYYSTHGEHYEKIKTKTWAIFSPLFAGLYTPEEAKKVVVEELFNPKSFGAPYGVPTVSREEPSFDPTGFWRGPTWIAVNWFIFHGLMRYGFTEEATKIMESSIALVEKSGFREHFHPDTGEGYGAKEFTWGALTVDMLEHQAQANGHERIV